MGAPLIGLTTSELREKGRVTGTLQGDPPQRELALGLSYLRAVEEAGGLPVVLPPLRYGAVAPLLDNLSGIVLSGGPDLDPAGYGASAHSELGPIEPEADRFELEVARLAWRRALPVLAICRGMQALNVARGGSLVQHLPDEVGSDVEHRQTEAAHEVTHPVEVERGSRLAGLMRPGRVDVNSFHHQAIDRLGAGLRVSARSPDGVIEGVEAPQRLFVVGVQWHAECLAARAEQAALFDGLVRAAGTYGISSTVARAA
jgi:putative glutamine amidotransferase